MLSEKIKDYKIILASQSPRRQQLLKELGLEFEVRPVNVDEIYPKDLKHHQIALYLSELKARSFDFEEFCEKCLNHYG